VGLRHELGPLFEVNVAGKAKPFWIAPNPHYRISDGGCSRFEPGLGIAFQSRAESFAYHLMVVIEPLTLVVTQEL
jgi:hypothetical protein